MSTLPLGGPARPELRLRPYQQEAINQVVEAEARGVHRQLGQAFTGAGKTLIMGSLAAQLGRPTLILAHRDELISQAAEKVAWCWPEANIGVVKAERNDLWNQVVVASIQTLAGSRRLERLLARHYSAPFGLVVVDEAHHASSPTYRKVLDALGCRSTLVPDNPEFDIDVPPPPLLLGVTATPDRGDRARLDDIFDEITFAYDIAWGIEAGYLSDLRGVQVQLAVDLNSVERSGGDYQDGALGEALEAADAPSHVVAAWLEHALGRRTIVFCPTVDLARQTTNAFAAAGVRSDMVWGEQDLTERRRVLAAFGRGDLDVTNNVAVLTEGYDNPAVDCIVIARPTRSRALFAQMCGRGTRRFPGKEDCIILDLVGATADHKLCTVPSLLGIDPKGFTDGTAVASVALADIRAAKARTGVLQAREVELLSGMAKARIAWVSTKTGFAVGLTDETVVLEAREDNWVAYAIPHDSSNPVRQLGRNESLEWTQGVAEDYVRGHPAGNLASRTAPWRKGQPSAKQIDFARRLAIQVDPQWTKGQLSEKIDEVLANRRLRTHRRKT